MSNKSCLKPISRLHDNLVLHRRMHILARHLSEMAPDNGTLLDVGCGNGTVSRLIMDEKPGLSIQGIDVMARPVCAIPMHVYDGTRFPFEDDSFDLVMFVDVLHHTPDPLLLLRESTRVARKGILIKDHLCDNGYARMVLRFMDWVGNRPHGVVLPYNYLSSGEWSGAWKQLGTRPDAYRTRLGLYPWFVRPLFEYGLHFIAHIPLSGAVPNAVAGA